MWYQILGAENRTDESLDKIFEFLIPQFDMYGQKIATGRYRFYVNLSAQYFQVIKMARTNPCSIRRTFNKAVTQWHMNAIDSWNCLPETLIGLKTFLF